MPHHQDGRGRRRCTLVVAGPLALLAMTCGTGTAPERETPLSDVDAEAAPPATDSRAPAPTGPNALAPPPADRPEAASLPPAPQEIGGGTPSASFTLCVGCTTELRLPQGSPEPTVEGTAVAMIPVATFSDTGMSQWELRGVQSGEAEVLASTDQGERRWTFLVDRP